MFPNSKRVVNTLTHSIGLVLMLLMVAIPAQAQLQVAVDIQLGSGDRQLSETTSIAASQGDQVVIEVFASGIDGSFGFNAQFQLSDPNAVTAATGTNVGGPYTLALTPTIDNGLISLPLGALGSTVSIPSGPPQFVGSLTLTLGQISSLSITLTSADPGTGPVPQNIALTVSDPSSLPIISGVAADLDSRLGNQGITNARINPGLLFPIEIYGGGLQKVTGYEIQLQMDDLSNFDVNNVRFEARTPFTATSSGGSGGSSLPTPATSNSPRVAADIVVGNQGDAQYNRENLSVTGEPGGTVAIELYGTGYQDVGRFVATLELSDPSVVNTITITPSLAFNVKLEEPTRDGNIVTASVGFLGSTTAPNNDLLLLGTLVINLKTNVGNGLGITVKSIAFQSAIAEDVVVANAVLTVTGAGGPNLSIGSSTVEVSGNTLIARATSPLPVSGSNRLGTFGLSTSNTFRGGQITVSQITVSSDTKSTTLEPGIVLKLGSIVSGAPVVVRPPIPVTVTDTRAIIQWETNVISTGTIVYGTSRTNLDQEAQATSQDRVHTARLSGLTLGTRYFFQVTNTDERATSEAFPPLPAQFVTRNRPDNQPPRVLLGPVAFGITNARADIVLETDEAAVIEVLYGTSQTDLSLTVSRSSSELRHKLVLESLTPNTRYFYRAKVTDLNGNPTTTDVKSFVTRTGEDNFPPRILGRPSLLSRSFNATVVQWFTDEASNSTVIYGTDAASLTDSTTTDEATREHKVSLGNLLTGTQYFFQVKSADASGNEFISPTANFTTSTSEDTQAPRFVRPPVVPRRGNTEALIVFETNEPTTATVQFATTTDVYTDDTGTVGESVSATDVSRKHEITLTNLDISTRYYFKVEITDLASNGPTTNPGQQNFATRTVADTSPPVVFSRPVAQGITNTGAIIRWGADEPHSAVIRFGPVTAGKQATSTDLTESVEDITATQKHAVTLADLTAGTTYAYEVETTDAVGNISTSTNLKFTTAAGVDTSPPVIVRPPVARNITATTATINWITNEISDSRVSVGTSTDYTNVISDATGTREHSVTLTGLEAGTVYHYAVGSADQTGNVVTTDATGTIIGLSKDHTFRTLATEDTQSPVIIEGPIIEFTDQIAVVSWLTDELSTSRVTMGVASGSANITDSTPVFGTTSELVFDENRLVTLHSVTVTGLSPGLGYIYQASSTDASGNTVNTSTPSGASAKLQVPGGFGSFTTSTESDSQFPVITNGPTVVASTSSSLTIEWETDESANSNVNFGTSADNLGDQEISGNNVNTHRVVLTKLAAGTTYAYEVASTDASGNGETRSKAAFGTTPSTEDLTAPTISTAPTIIYKNDRSATIQWITNEAANAEVAFGTTADNLINILTLPDFDTEHTMTLTNLDANTTYHFKASSTDQSNNGPTSSSTLSFTTDSVPDTQNPTVSDVAASVADSSAIISWKTDEVSDTAVRYSTTSGTYGFNTGDATDVANHRITLTNLLPNTTYFYVVESIDRSGNGPAQSAENSFTTKATGDVQAPAPPSGLVVQGGNGAVKLFWAASASSGVVSYIIERSAASGDFAPVVSIDPATAYVDNNVTNGTAYTYRLASVGLKQLTSTASTSSESVTPSADGGPSVPALFGIQGNRLTPTIVISNSTPLNTTDVLGYTFHLATSSDYSDAIALEAGISSGAGTGAGDPSGVTAFTVARTLTDGTTYHYRVKASDGTFDSAFLTGSFVADAKAPEFPGDLNGDKAVSFPDFLSFIGTFNKSTGQDGFLTDADLNGDGSVSFPDFLTFIGVFNKKYISGASSGKPIVEMAYGENTEAQFQLIGHPLSIGETGQEIAVDVKLSNATDLMGYGVRISYDPSTLQFVNATDKGETLLKTGDRQTDLFGTLEHDAEKGEVFIAGAITNGNPVEGQGVLATLQFRLLGDDPQKALIEIAQGLLIDGGLNPSIARNLGGRFALVPTEYALEHNFPNPFNPETTLKYAIPTAGDVTLIVYNVLGQEIVRLIDAKQTPGFYTVRWNGQDALGHSVASGVYLYRIQAGDFNQTHKMLLLK